MSKRDALILAGIWLATVALSVAVTSYSFRPDPPVVEEEKPARWFDQQLGNVCYVWRDHLACLPVWKVPPPRSAS